MADKKIKMAIVDDEPSVREICEVYFQMAGYEVAVFACGEEFLEALISGYMPEAVLLDVMMPGMNGLEVCREIKKDPVYKEIKVIMFTALSGSAIEVQSQKAGADALMCKGMDMPGLTEAITTMF